MQWSAQSRSRTLFCAVLLLGGCDKAGLVPAGGRVVLDGEPLARATVTLLPQAGGGRPAVALTREDGSFELKTNNDRGALPGKYKALVAKDEPASGSDATEATAPSPPEHKLIGNADRAEMEQGMQKLTRFPVRSLIPERYASPLTSQLDCEIPPGGTKSLRLELEAK